MDIPTLVLMFAIDYYMEQNNVYFSQTKGGPGIRKNINSGKHNILGKDKTVEGKGKKMGSKNINFEDHTCIQSRAIKACTSRFLVDHVIKSLATNPNIPVRAVQDQMQKQFEVGVLKMKAFRAKRIASDIITGSYREQYSLLTPKVSMKKIPCSDAYKFDTFKKAAITFKASDTVIPKA
ncbi:hypothetical protein Tco_0242108 [Tanacetum coccineum]